MSEQYDWRGILAVEAKLEAAEARVRELEEQKRIAWTARDVEREEALAALRELVEAIDQSQHPGVFVVDPMSKVLQAADRARSLIDSTPEPRPPGIVKTPAGESSRPSTPPTEKWYTERELGWIFVFIHHSSGTCSYCDALREQAGRLVALRDEPHMR